MCLRGIYLFARGFGKNQVVDKTVMRFLQFFFIEVCYDRK